MSDPIAGMSPGLTRQMEIYKAGLAGKTPEQPVTIEELESEAKSVLSFEAFDYLAGGAGSEDTLRANREAFRGWRLVPRFLRDVSSRDLGVEVLGQRLPAPVLLAPIGVMSILHKEAELAVARATGPLGVPMILSTLSSTSDGAGGPGHGRCPALVPALLAQERRAGRQFRRGEPSSRVSPPSS